MATLPLSDVVRLVASRVLLPHAFEQELQVVGIGTAVEKGRLSACLPHFGTHGLQAVKDKYISAKLSSFLLKFSHCQYEITCLRIGASDLTHFLTSCSALGDQTTLS